MSQKLPPADQRPPGSTAGAHPTTERLAVPAAPASRRTLPSGPLRWAVITGALALVLALLALLVRPSDPMSDSRPVDVVKGFAAAIEARDASAMLQYVEPTVFRREIGPEVRSYVEYLREVRFDNPRYELLDNDGATAHVRWLASMHYAVGDGDQARSGDRSIDTTFELRKIEESWYLHEAKLPSSQ